MNDVKFACVKTAIGTLYVSISRIDALHRLFDDSDESIERNVLFVGGKEFFIDDESYFRLENLIRENIADNDRKVNNQL